MIWRGMWVALFCWNGFEYIIFEQWNLSKERSASMKGHNAPSFNASIQVADKIWYIQHWKKSFQRIFVSPQFLKFIHTNVFYAWIRWIRLVEQFSLQMWSRKIINIPLKPKFILHVSCKYIVCTVIMATFTSCITIRIFINYLYCVSLKVYINNNYVNGTCHEEQVKLRLKWNSLLYSRQANYTVVAQFEI